MGDAHSCGHCNVFGTRRPANQCKDMPHGKLRGADPYKNWKSEAWYAGASWIDTLGTSTAKRWDSW